MRVLASLVLSLVVAGHVRSQAAPDLDTLRQVLTQPGPDARIEREAAVETLLSRTDTASHDVLREVVRRGPDADGLALTVLSQLRRKLANPHDAVFGNGEREKGVGRGYVPALAALFSAPALGNEAATKLREEARQCVAALSAVDRRRAFETLLTNSEPELRRGAMMLVGCSRDLGLAPMLAAALDAPDSAAAARDALARLTFVDSFASKEQFDQWWADHDNSSYLVLAEQAAQRARDGRGVALRRAEARSMEILVELVDALAARDNVAWARIAERALADDPPGSMRLCLERLRDVLARAPRHGGVAADRLALLARLQAHLGEATLLPELHAVLLEVCAYLVAPGEDKQAEEVGNLLRQGLAHEAATVRRAAALGYARFVTVDATRLLVQAGVRARAAGEQAVLGAVFASLAAPARSAPHDDPDTFAAWLALVDGVLRDDTAPESVREAALAVLTQKGPHGKHLDQVFKVLIGVTLNRAQTPLARERASVLLLPHAAAAPVAARTYVDTLIELLTDPEKRMRLKGAQLLQSLPKHNEFAAEWRGRVISAVGEVLAKETDEGVLRALVTCLERQVDPEKPDLEPVIARLCLALEEMVGVSGARRQFLVSALAGQAATQGLDTIQWVRAAETLLQLGERRELRNVIERQVPVELAERPDVRPQVLRLALECVVRTALLKPRGEAWTKGEAQDVLAAMALLDRQATSAQPVEWLLLRIEVSVVVGRFDDVLQRAKQALDAGSLDPTGRDRVRVAMLRANLGINNIDEAQRLLENGVAAGDPATVAQLREEIGLAMLRLERPKDALALFVEAQQATAESDPLYPRRLLRRLDAEERADPAARAAILQRLLAREALFAGTEVAAEVRVEFDQLKGRLSGKL